MSILRRFLTTTQPKLFPALELAIGEPLSEKTQLFVKVVELIQPERFIECYEWQGVGRERKHRLPILLAFIAKAVWNHATTRATLDWIVHHESLRRLCGWDSRRDIPSESTFSRAFEEFAQGELPQRIHEALVRAQASEKLVGHISRDSTAIEAREKPTPKAPKPADGRPKARRGRPRKDEQRPPKSPGRLELQSERTLEENLADLPRACDVGAKRNAKGNLEYWIGYKLHLDVIDGGIPVSAILTSASLHDSQAAIALAQMSARRVTSLYDLMDAAYDAKEIRDYSIRLEHVPIIDANARRGEPPVPMDPARARRYQERTTVERVNSDLKDNHGGRTLRVRGAAKAMAHLMYGLLVVTVKAWCGLLSEPATG